MKINQLQIEIDGIDKEILRDLMEDARKPILQIANKIGISGAAIHQRLRKLEDAGVIASSKLIVDNKVLGAGDRGRDTWYPPNSPAVYRPGPCVYCPRIWNHTRPSPACREECRRAFGQSPRAHRARRVCRRDRA